MNEEIVAVSTAKKGGPCAQCQTFIPKSGFIAKIGTEGQTTKAGQGPGFWVCESCSKEYEWNDDATDGRAIAYRDFRPDIYEDLDTGQEAPRGFLVGMRHSSYQKIAYQLGYYHGYQDRLDEENR